MFREESTLRNGLTNATIQKADSGNRGILPSMAWKLKQLHAYHSYGFPKLTFGMVLKELFDKQERFRNYSLFKSSFAEVFVRDKYGINLVQDTPFGTIEEVFGEGIYLEYPDFIPQPGSTVLDVGAQGGDFSLLCSVYLKCKKVIAIEPLPVNFDILIRNIGANASPNIQPVQAAASDKEGKVQIAYEGDTAFKGSSPGEMEVDSVRLDSLILDALDVIKIDVEGFEMDVLAGALQLIDKFRPKIILEVHTRALKTDAINLLSEHGYGVAHEGRSTSYPHHNMDLVQNLFFGPVEK